MDNPSFDGAEKKQLHRETRINGVENAAFSTSIDDAHVNVKPTSTVVIADTIPAKDDSLDDFPEAKCGWGPCRPSCLQVFNRTGLFVVWVCIACFLEGFAVNGIANAGLPAIEKQFQLPSSKSALISSSQDIGALIIVLFVSFIGGRYHKPMIIATGAVLMGIGSFLFMVPHFAEEYVYEDSNGNNGPQDLCDPTRSTEGGGPPCVSGAGQRYLAVFIVAQLIHGIGFTPMLTLGPVFIDENEEPGLAAIFVGLTYASAAVGVACGFFIGGQLVQKVFVDFDRVDQDSLGFDFLDLRWVGAWWVGFIITTVGFVLVAIPLFGYYKYMPGNTKVRDRYAQQAKEDKKSVYTLVKELMKDFFRAFLKLIVNPTFIFLTLGGCAEALILFGVSSFSFKYLAEQYNLPFEDAGFMLGGLILVGSVGMFLGGLLIKLFKLEIAGMTRLNVVSSFLAAVLGLAYLAKCPETQLAGLELPYSNQSSVTGYNAPCHSLCNCENMRFSPVCGKDGIVYYSACHAGCKNSTSMGSYSECSCVADTLGLPVTDTVTSSFGRCDDGCTNISILAPCLFIMMIFVLLTTTPTSMATLRCVDEDIQPFALGLQWMCLRLLGSIPGPVLVGTVIDKACLLWQGGACSESGFCLLYSKHDLSMGVTIWWVVASGVAFLFYLAAFIAQSRRSSKAFTLNH